jgi:uncharacterized protein YndB with AHSA1/START domain
MADSKPAADLPGIAITRVFDAPRERVWKEWTEPDRFADWFGGTEAEIPVSSVSMDVRVGGAWRATMFAGRSRREIQWKGSYQEVLEPERLVFTLSDQPGDGPYEPVRSCSATWETGAPGCTSSSAGRWRPSSTSAAVRGGRSSLSG